MNPASTTKLIEAERKIGTTPDIRRKALLRCLNSRSLTKFIDIHSGLSALIVEKTKIITKGKIDEFVLFQEAYDEIAIRRLFEIGCPYEIPNAFSNFTP